MPRAEHYLAHPYGALMLAERADYDALIAALSEHIGSGQPAGAAVHNRGLAYWETGEPDKALADFERAASLLPRSYMPHHIEGMLLRQLGRSDEALLAFNRAVATSPDQATARRARAFLLVELGRLEDALHDFDRAIALEPSFERTRDDRDHVRARLDAARRSVREVRPWWRFWRR